MSDTDAPDYIEFNEVKPETRDDLAALVGAHEPGIYFGMDEAEYHRDRSLSASGAKDLMVSPLTFWMKSAFNPDRTDDSTEPKERGKAFHVRLLEGAERFGLLYAVKPDQRDHPGALDGAVELKARCKELSLTVGGTIAELCARIRTKDTETPLWPEIIEHFEHDANQLGQTIIKPKLANEIERHARIVEAHMGTNKAFRGGFPEVSIFWRDAATGVPCKSRIDYLKTRAGIELKTFSNPIGLPLDTAIARTTATQKYNVDAIVRLSAIERAKAMYRNAGKSLVHGEVPAPDWLKAFSEPGPHAFVFVFLEAGDVPNVRVREVRRTEAGEKATENLYWTAAKDTFNDAIKRYRACLEHYGADLPWVDPQPMRPFVDTDFPAWAFD